ncbi:AlwI family type II restriction endonuclease [Treponema sp.]|uniref:AlwI family type II restriction endonuclease n=1 Tax=Treponema sp. TaxID=166 RepID=UPI002A80B8B0|nr:AlwI family type II restriction endonuclease [Treponema sp.]MDY4132554.1 AlwI family type II restriction endonuclease [Treponema sp.]
MAKSIDSKVLFITTSPRTPEKMIPEIDLLSKNFEGKKWNTETQIAFMELLRNENFFNGSGNNDPAFSARDRINRAPKALGFILLEPTIKLTESGKALISAKRKEEVFLRQLLKFQIPSPYHTPSEKAADFYVKPYLEILRLIYTLGTLKFDELMIFGLQLTDYREFNNIVKKIEKFRIDREKTSKKYREFKYYAQMNELQEIYSSELAKGETSTRESNIATAKKFLQTKASNMHDYADACIRYLRATGLVSISHIGRSLSILPEKKKDVEFILNNISREPVFIDDKAKYLDYLGNSELPKLLTDNKDSLLQKIKEENPTEQIQESVTIHELKEKLDDLIITKREKLIQSQIAEIKDYKKYDDIQTTFTQIEENDIYDPSLILEWNVWRGMTMLDGGNIKANLKFDDFGNPMSTAQGNMADIVCDYETFGLTVEVTMASGQKQYEMEGEPVSRHLAKFKKETGKEAYCLFVAPTINEACIAHFYGLHNLNISYYGGKSVIVPLPLNVFKKMLVDSFKASYTPNPQQVKSFFEYSKSIASESHSEQEWYNKIVEKALNWLE